ncbi:MAG TPA: 4'-phosphopantetheinyl transferase superfamily protein [Verrucomicrobiae bacterium]|nr:4'-phosphopantetheinyl transferase superfamily protein [Verrucomicrobiae bacterium]
MPELEINWPTPATFPPLADNEVHVWAAPLDLPPAQLAAIAPMLSPYEQARAARFHFERDRGRFIAGRGFLRALLSRYLQTGPSQLKFAYGPRGKPALAAPADQELHFNLAHSDGLALCAVTRACPVGVDVERIRPLRDAEGITDRFFSARESAALKAIPAEQKPIAFFNLWTRKEAWLKATGDGLSESLDKSEVSLLPDEPARFFSILGDSRAAAAWTLEDLSPATGFKAALAAQAQNLRLQCWHWGGG